MLNPLLLGTAIPPIPEAQGWVSGYDGAAGPLLDLSQAVPGYPPPDVLLERLAQSAGQAATAAYGAIFGDAVLREVYAAHVGAAYGAAVRVEEVAITTGCNQAFMVAMLAIVRAGEAVMLPTPWYFNHKMALDMLGIRTVPLACNADQGFVPDVVAAEALIEPGLRAIVLVTPNNPTGAVYPPATIQAFADLCRRRGLTLILDETYRDFIDDRPHQVFSDPTWSDTVISLYSFSKAYCIPGHRLGALTAGARTLGQVAKILDTLQICAPRVAQAPVAWAIEALAGWRDANRREIQARAAAFRAAVQGQADWRISSVGAYFAFLRHGRTGATSTEVARDLVERRGVLCLPGAYFGPNQEDHLRVAFANVESDRLALLSERLADFG
ncbi:MAG: aminotransferase [Caulobacteraceae bacterium]|nr:aminotransferase [Caulobacteraceae bacterium]